VLRNNRNGIESGKHFPLPHYRNYRVGLDLDPLYSDGDRLGLMHSHRRKNGPRHQVSHSGLSGYYCTQATSHCGRCRCRQLLAEINGNCLTSSRLFCCARAIQWGPTTDYFWALIT